MAAKLLAALNVSGATTTFIVWNSIPAALGLLRFMIAECAPALSGLIENAVDEEEFHEEGA